VTHSGIDGIISADRRGMVRSWNPAAAKLFGPEEKEMLGWPLDRIIPERRRGPGLRLSYAIMVLRRERLTSAHALRYHSVVCAPGIGASAQENPRPASWSSAFPNVVGLLEALKGS
jgi:PAS domain-containing protein